MSNVKENLINDNLVDLDNLSEYEFSFQHVSFAYPETGEKVLKDICLEIKSSEKLAVVGKNGAGKSTLIKLLLRLYDPTEGRILLNGVDIRSFDRQQYYAVFAPIFQDASIFADTIEGNIKMSERENEEATSISDVLKMAGITQKISKLEKGIKTELSKVFSEDGIDLSGGEIQKVIFARALYKKAKVLVLDEPTASMDARSEAQMFETIDQIVKNRTTVIITHKLSAVLFCDRIVVLDHGQVSGVGTHKELFSENRIYSEMYRQQASSYIEGQMMEAEHE